MRSERKGLFILALFIKTNFVSQENLKLKENTVIILMCLSGFFTLVFKNEVIQ